MEPLVRLAAALFALTLLGLPARAQTDSPLPPPPMVVVKPEPPQGETVDIANDAAVQAWIAKYITSGGWSLASWNADGVIMTMLDAWGRVVARFEFFPTFRQPYRSMIVIFEADCAGRRVRQRSKQVYAKQNMQSMIAKPPVDETWAAIEPDSGSELLWQRACEAVEPAAPPGR
jgi:hypothetical protein